ncbi:MAG: histidine kinase [Ferruginibacter sp.]
MRCEQFYRNIVFFAVMISYTHAGLAQKTNAAYKSDLEKATSAKAKADICFEISNNYSSRLKIDSAIYFANQVKEFSGQAKYETGIGKYHLALAIALTYRSKNDEVRQNASKAIDIFTRQKENILLGRVHLVLGSSLHEDNVVQARKNYWLAVACFMPTGDAKGLYSAYRWLAYSYFKTSGIDSASFYQIKSLAMAEQLKDAEKTYQSACWVGSTFLSMGELKNALRYFEYGLKKRTGNTDKIGLRDILADYATCLILLHKPLIADSVTKEIELLNAEFKDIYGSVLLNGLKGTFAYERKNYLEAVMYLQKAYQEMDQLELATNDTKNIQFLLGRAEYETHSYDSAIQHLKSAIRTDRNSGFIIDESEASLLISKCFQQKGNADSALYYFKDYAVLKDSILSQQKQKNIIEATTRYETEKKEQAIKLLEKEAAYQKLLQAKQNQQKKIFYAAIAVILLVGGYGLYRYIRKKKLQNRQEVSNERLRISSELHDEVGATLSGVALFSEIAKQKMEDQLTDEAKVYLDHISVNSKEMVEKMSDIVWALNPENDSFERIIAKIQSYAFNVCASKGIALHINISDEMRNDYPVMLVKRNLYLFMKEAINNAIKYAEGKNIFLSLHKTGDLITAEIKDDGKGFDTRLSNGGNGLKNMKDRAASLDAKFVIESTKEKGTCIRLQFYFHPAGG